MSKFNSFVLDYVKKDTPEQVRAFFLLLTQQTGQYVDVISVERVGSFWYAWYYRNINQHIPSSTVEVVRPKTEVKKLPTRRKTKRG